MVCFSLSICVLTKKFIRKRKEERSVFLFCTQQNSTNFGISGFPVSPEWRGKGPQNKVLNYN